MTCLSILGCWRPPCGRHLDTVDVDAAHATTAIDEEDEFAVNFAQVRADGLEVGTEVEHNHGVVEDVLMEASADDVHLENNHSPALSALLRSIVENFQLRSQRIHGANSERDAAYQYYRFKTFQTACGEPLECFHRNTPLWLSALCFNLKVKSAPHHVGNMEGCTKHETVSHKRKENTKSL